MERWVQVQSASTGSNEDKGCVAVGVIVGKRKDAQMTQ